jgi:ABC-type branched-subunit amino acid transport system substrate-binding protein
VTSLAATNADAFVLGATLLACPNALQAMREAGWSPITYMSGTCTSKTLMNLAGPAGDGVLSSASIMDPNDPRWASDERMRLYKEKVPRYSPDADITNGIVAYGWTAAAFLVKTLEQAGTASRLAVMEAARTLDVEGVGLMMPDIRMSVDAKDWFLGETFTLVRYDGSKG